MASDAEARGRQMLAARVLAAALGRGWKSYEAAASGCDLNVATYRLVVTNNRGTHRPQDETLRKLAAGLDLDLEELIRLRMGAVSLTGDRELDEHVEVVRRLAPEQRPPVYHFAALPPQQSSLIYDFVRQLTKAVSAGAT